MELSVESLETPALTKAHLADLLFEQIGLNKRESKDMVEAFFELISDALVEGEDIKISSFGNFQIRTKAPRPGRNPRTGQAVPIEARRVVTFHATDFGIARPARVKNISAQAIASRLKLK